MTIENDIIKDVIKKTLHDESSIQEMFSKSIKDKLIEKSKNITINDMTYNLPDSFINSLITDLIENDNQLKNEIRKNLKSSLKDFVAGYDFAEDINEHVKWREIDSKLGELITKTFTTCLDVLLEDL